MKYILPVLL